MSEGSPEIPESSHTTWRRTELTPKRHVYSAAINALKEAEDNEGQFSEQIEDLKSRRSKEAYYDPYNNELLTARQGTTPEYVRVPTLDEMIAMAKVIIEEKFQPIVIAEYFYEDQFSKILRLPTEEQVGALSEVMDDFTVDYPSLKETVTHLATSGLSHYEFYEPDDFDTQDLYQMEQSIRGIIKTLLNEASRGTDLREPLKTGGFEYKRLKDELSRYGAPLVREWK